MVVAKTKMDKLPQICNDCEKVAVANTEGEYYCSETFRLIKGLTSKPDWCPLVEMEQRTK